MDLYYDLKKMLCKELDEVSQKKTLSAGDLEVVDKLTHSIKSLLYIMDMEDNERGGYSGARRRDSMGRYADGMYYDDYSSDGGYSGRRYMDGYSGRRYSYDEGKAHMVHEFEKLMEKASTQEEREIIQSAISKLKNNM